MWFLSVFLNIDDLILKDVNLSYFVDRIVDSHLEGEHNAELQLPEQEILAELIQWCYTARLEIDRRLASELSEFLTNTRQWNMAKQLQISLETAGECWDISHTCLNYCIASFIHIQDLKSPVVFCVWILILVDPRIFHQHLWISISSFKDRVDCY